MIIKPNYKNNNKLLLNKLDIFKDNKDKSGIYILYNIINNKIYIGRSTDLRRRFMEYYNINYLKNRKVRNRNSRVCNALLIYGYTNFRLEVLEYSDKNSIAEREQYNIYLFQPEYNIRCKSGKVYSY
jgi:group I intron endonuclease